MKTYKQLVEYLGREHYHYYMGGGDYFTFEEEMIKFIYGKAPTMEEIEAAAEAFATIIET
jgi:hypothetical protein